MVHYLTLGGSERPVCFSYAVAYEYETQTGKFYEPDLKEFAEQVIRAGAQVGTDDVGTAARLISMVKFVDILHACLLVGHRKSKTLVAFDKYDVAEWVAENPDAVSRFTTLLFEANFNLPGAPQSDDQEEGDDAKKKTTAPKKLTGTNS